MAVDQERLPLHGALVNLQTGADVTTTTNGTTRTIDRCAAVANGIIGRVRLATVNGGTPTLDADIEDSWDGTNWNLLVSFAQLTAAGEETLAPTRLPGPFIRGRAVIGGGSPDIDFQIDILGVTLK